MKLRYFLNEEQPIEDGDIDFISDFVNKGRAKEKGVTDKDVDPKELKRGVKVEYEHTSNEFIAKRIALDHLAECDDYYTKLEKMELSCEGVDESMIVEDSMNMKGLVRYHLQHLVKGGWWVADESFDDKYLKTAQNYKKEFEGINKEWQYRIVKETRKYEIMR